MLFSGTSFLLLTWGVKSTETVRSTAHSSDFGQDPSLFALHIAFASVSTRVPLIWQRTVAKQKLMPLLEGSFNVPLLTSPSFFCDPSLAGRVT